MFWLFAIFSTLFIFSFLFTYLIRLFSLKNNILDIPNDRSSHKSPTPRGGGLAFVSFFYLGLSFLWLNHFIAQTLFLSLLGGIPIACVGYCDDVFGVKAKWRACVHALSAIWGIAWLGGIPFLNFGEVVIHNPVLFFVLGTFITVWFVNLYNFMDGIDGLAGMEAIFVSGTAGCILLLSGGHAVALICFVLMFSVGGFLVLNWPPAKIFMGDVGSGFIGYVFAMLMWITNNAHQLPFLIWWILLGVFLGDASYTLIHRMIQRKNWRQAHREHAYQRMVQSGLSHKQVTTSILCINLIICLPLALFYLHLQTNSVLVLYTLSILSVFWMAWFLITRKCEVC